MDDLGDRHVRLAAVAQHARGPRLQADQRADRLAGLALGARLEQAPEQDERDDERSRIEVHRRAETVVIEEGREQHAGGAVEVGRRGAHRHQGVHGGAAVAGRGQGGAIELAADPELHRRGQRPQHPAVREERGHEGEAHAAQEDEGRQHGADHDLAAQSQVGRAPRERLGIGLAAGLGGRRGGAAGRLGDVVAGPPHRRHEAVAAGNAGHVLDGGLLGGQVDLRPAARRAPWRRAFSLRATQLAQVMPEMTNVSVAAGTS